MLWILMMVDKPVEAKTTVVQRNPITQIDIRAEALKEEGKGPEAAELLRSYYGGTIIDARLMEEIVRAKDAVYKIRREPFSPPAPYRPLWKSEDSILAMTIDDDKYFDVVKDPRSDTLYAAVTYGDSVVLYRGTIDYVGRTITWSRWTSHAFTRAIHNPDIAVDGKYVYVAFAILFSATDHDPALLQFKRSDGSIYGYGYWFPSPDFEDFPTVTTDYESYSAADYVYYAYWDADKDSVMFVRIDDPDSTDYTSYGGIAYAVGDHTTVNRMSMDYFNDGDSSHLLLAYMTNGDTVLLADGSPFGSSWTARAANFGVGYFPYIKALSGTPYVGVVYSRPWSETDYDCYIQYSTDGGASFTRYGCGTTTLDELWPTMTFAADTVWVSYLRGDKDTPVDSITDTMSVMVAALPLSGGYALRSDSINDPSYRYGVLTTWHPVITGPEDTAASKQFLHVAWSRRYLNIRDFDVYMDYHFFDVATNTEEAPSSATSRPVVLRNGVEVSGYYRIYDISGRLVGSGYAEGSKFIPLRKGSYFVKTRNGLRSIIIR